MNAKSITSVLVALCMTGPVIAGQAQGTTGQKKADNPPAESAPAAKKPVAGMQEVAVPVTGLTAEGTEKVQSALTAMTTPVWTCEGCHVEMRSEGACSACGEKLERERMQVVDKVQISQDPGMLRLALRPNRTLSLSELDAALRKASVTVDGTRMMLGGTTTLVLSGLEADQTAAMEKALVDSKMFSSARGTYDEASKETRIQATAAAAAPTRAAVELFVTQSSLHPRLSDIVLGAQGSPRG
jgi:hypothetical protein